MKKYQVLLFDVDGTLLDFDKAEKIGIERVLTHFGVPATEENVQKYHHLNKSYWQKLERGEITREQVLSLRFEDFFSDFGIKVNGAEVDGLYRQTLNESAFLLDGVMDLLNGLKNHYELHIVTNGVAETQYKRLAAAGLDKLFQGIYVSEESGYQKPQQEYFDYCFEKMGRNDVENMLIIGDSLTSDIRGGNNAGIDTLWYNPHHQENTAGVHVDYEADTLEKIGEMLS